MIHNLKTVIRSFSRSFTCFLVNITNKLVLKIYQIVNRNLQNMPTKFHLGYAIRGWLILMCCLLQKSDFHHDLHMIT